jgi:hypothetical protein
VVGGAARAVRPLAPQHCGRFAEAGAPPGSASTNLGETMRVLIAVLALVATPVIASVAQAQGSTPPASVRQNCANDHRWQEGNHLGDKNASKQGCDPSGGGTGGTGT